MCQAQLLYKKGLHIGDKYRRDGCIISSDCWQINCVRKVYGICFHFICVPHGFIGTTGIVVNAENDKV